MPVDRVTQECRNISMPSGTNSLGPINKIGIFHTVNETWKIPVKITAYQTLKH
jgi:hypothetical protein